MEIRNNLGLHGVNYPSFVHFTLKKALKRQECTDSELVTKCTTSTMSNAIPISFFYHSNKNKPLLSTYHVKFSEYMKFRKNLSQTYENMGPKTWQIYTNFRNVCHQANISFVNIGKFGVAYSMRLEYLLDCYEKRWFIVYMKNCHDIA